MKSPLFNFNSSFTPLLSTIGITSTLDYTSDPNRIELNPDRILFCLDRASYTTK